MKSFKIALAQFSPYISNLEKKTQKMLEQANEAKKQQADLIIFPELSLIGYPAEDGIPSAMHFKREPLEKTVFYNEF